jgi:two-component system, sensor histidine kinase and response regulator
MAVQIIAGEASSQAAPQTPGAARILLVDDHVENLLALEAVLKELGHEIVKAASGKEALRCVLDSDFAVILMDVSMPELDGFETATLIRERDRSRHTPIIFLTAFSKSEQFVNKGYSTGAVDYIFKPFVPEILRAKVSVFIDLFKKTEQIRLQAQRLEAVNRELERSNAELQQFAYVASHDLKEPLRKIASFSDLVARGAGAKLEGKDKEYLGYIVDGVARMQSLIDDLLEYSRVGRGDRPLARVELARVLDRALSDLSVAVQESKAEIVHDDLPLVVGDAQELTQLFDNLIGNALKFRSESPRIKVSAERKGDRWLVSVKDNGIGIDAAYHERIFSLFKRLHSRDKYPGTGIGLAICKKVVEHHGGRIWVDSRPGTGSTFYFTLAPADA